MNYIKCFSCGETSKYYPYVPSKLYCFSCYDNLEKERDQLRAENERLKELLKEIEGNREHIERLLCKAEKRIADLEQERQWISVEEKPKYNDDYLVLTMDEYGGYQEVAQYIDGSFFDDYDNKIKPTYWQPLPHPPQESEE